MASIAEAPERDVLSDGLSRRSVWIAAGIVFLIAFGFRLTGIGWGLPSENRHQSLHPDEVLIKEVADRTPYLRPGFYNYGTLYLTALKVGTDMGRSYGWVKEGTSVPRWQTDQDIHRTGRIISAAAGAATVAIVFATLLMLTGLLGSSVGALSLLVASGHVVHSRFQTSDVMATLFVAAAIHFTVRLLRPQGAPFRQTMAAAVAIGLAAGTKYSGALMIIPLLLAIWWTDPKSFFRTAAIAVVSFVFVFVLATPGIILESSRFWIGFTYELAHSAAGHGIVFANTASAFAYQISNILEAFGIVPAVLGTVGIAYMAIKRHRWALILALFMLIYYFTIGRAEVKFLRYVLPLLPILAIGVGVLVGKLHRRGGYYRVATGAAVFLVGASLAGSRGAIAMTGFMARQDPRDQAAAWLDKQNGTIGFVSDPWFYSPPLFPDTGLLSPKARLEAMEQNPRLVRYVSPDGPKLDWDPRLITGVQPDTIVISSFEFVDSDRTNQPSLLEFMPLLSESYQLAAIVWGGEVATPPTGQPGAPVTRESLREIIGSRYPTTHDMMYIQPTICILRKK
ncbi:MAG: glycosyltransferase family 39 protein [Fimbriimonadales bacterium]